MNCEIPNNNNNDNNDNNNSKLHFHVLINDIRDDKVNKSTHIRFRAYSFGYLKFLLKTGFFAETNVSYQKNANYENGRVNRLCREKNAKGIRILKTVEFADFTEKNAKRIHILNTVELADFAEKTPKIMNILKEKEFDALCNLSQVSQLQQQKVFEACDFYRFQKSPKENVNNDLI